MFYSQACTVYFSQSKNDVRWCLFSTVLILIECYGKCSKILNTILFLISTKMFVIRDGVHKMLVRIANREDPDQTASSEAV